MKLALDGWRAIRIAAPDRLAAVARLDAVVIIGASCVGKTTLVDAVRAASVPGVDLPVRYVTRPPRAGDHAAEAAAISADALDALDRRGELAVRWPRRMELDRVTHYAFARSPAGALPVYSANTAICEGQVRPPEALAGALIVGVDAPGELRRRRLARRSPDLTRDRAAEVAHRLAERADAIEPHAHVVIANDEPHEAIARIEIVELITRLRDVFAARSS